MSSNIETLDTETPDFSAFEVISHGFDHSQYFQGCGLFRSPFNSVVTGAGGCEKEALEDALEQMAGNGASLSLIEQIEKSEDWSETRNEEADAEEMNEVHYFLSIRYNMPAAR